MHMKYRIGGEADKCPAVEWEDGEGEGEGQTEARVAQRKVGPEYVKARREGPDAVQEDVERVMQEAEEVKWGDLTSRRQSTVLSEIIRDKHRVKLAGGKDAGHWIDRRLIRGGEGCRIEAT